MPNSYKPVMNKKLMIILLAVGVIAAVTGIVFTFIQGGKDKTDKQPAAAPAEARSTAASAEPNTAPPKTEQPVATEEPQTLPTIDIALPSASGEAGTFSAVYLPSSAAEEAATGKKVSLRSLFGQGYTDGAMTFNADGTFTDTLNPTGTAAGAYQVADGKLVATYLPDKNMDVTVTAWDETKTKPIRYTVTYSFGEHSKYNVFFTEKK